MEVGIQESKTFIIILNIFESRQKINRALVKQSPQKQLLLSFIYFLQGIFWFYSEIHIFIAEPGFAFIFPDGINFLFHPAAGH